MNLREKKCYHALVDAVKHRMFSKSSLRLRLLILPLWHGGKKCAYRTTQYFLFSILCCRYQYLELKTLRMVEMGRIFKNLHDKGYTPSKSQTMSFITEWLDNKYYYYVIVSDYISGILEQHGKATKRNWILRT